MFPEIPEADATGEIAAYYSKIRAGTGVPVVNFVWRHLATIDGALAFAWPAVEKTAPLIYERAPEVGDAAQAALAASGLSNLGLGTEWPDGVQRVVAAYNVGNGWNFLSMTLLAALRAGASAPRAGQMASVDPIAPVPPFPAYGGLAPDLRAAIDRLAAAGPGGASGVRPSLWVHLAVWPEVLRAVADATVPILASPTFGAAYAAFFDRGAALLGVAAPPPTEVASEGEAPIDRAIRLFRLRIAEMVLFGHLLVRR